jgi:DNA mismatch repair protein MutL
MLESVGFDISDLGSGSYAIHGVPAGAEKLKPVEMVLELFEVLLNKETLSKEKLFYHVALTLAKKNAIEQGQILYQEGIKQLIDELFSCKIPNYTPDGKLVLTILPDDKMEGFFR